MEKIVKFYSQFNEDIRFFKQSDRIEYLTTIHFINNYLLRKSKIIELGAGTGNYSFYYLEKGHDVTAVEFVDNYVKTMKTKQTQNGNKLTILQQDAINLSNLENESFDVVLNLGPIYHQQTQKNQRLLLRESTRILKKNGILVVSYLCKFPLFIKLIREEKYLKYFIKDEYIDNILKEGRLKTEKNNFVDISVFFGPQEITSLISEFDIFEEVHVSTDSLTYYFKEFINTLDEKEFETYMNFHLKTCGNPSLTGSGLHGLYIGRKK